MVDKVVGNIAGVPNPKSDWGQNDERKANYIKNKPDLTVFSNALKGTASGEAMGITDISPIEHNMGVSVRGKNLIPYPYYYSTKTLSGITYTDNGDGSITVNGTATAFTLFEITQQSKNDCSDLFEDGVTYKLSSGVNNSLIRLTLGARKISENKAVYYYSGDTFTVDKSTYKYEWIRLQIESGKTVDNVTVYPMIEEGTTSTSYAPYIEDISTVKLYKQGKNLLHLSFSVELPYTKNGITFADNGDGGIKISGTATSSATIYYKNLLLFAGITYRLVHIGGVSGVNTFISYYDENGTAQLYATKSNANFTWKDTYTFRSCFLQVDSGKTVDVVIYPMLILSTEDRTEYEPYIEPTVYDVKADGSVDGVTSLYPNTTLYTDTQGAVIDVEYNRDINKAFAELQAMLLEG